MFYICMKSHKNISTILSYRTDTSVWWKWPFSIFFIIYYARWAIINKVCKPDLSFLCSAHPIIMFYIFMKFHENISNDFKIQSGYESMVEMANFNIQRATTLKVGKQQLRFICSAHCLMVFNNCVKFHENMSSGFKVMKWTRKL